jgi:hypothetical protein
MELIINLSDEQEIIAGQRFLALFRSHKSAQNPHLRAASVLAQPVPSLPPAVVEAPVPQLEPRGDNADTVGKDQARPNEVLLDISDRPVGRRRGRPPGSYAARKAAAEAARQPIGAIMPGVPARNLAAVLDDYLSAYKSNDVQVHTAPETDTAETLRKARIASGWPLNDPDLAGAFDGDKVT